MPSLPYPEFRARGYRTIRTPFFLLKTKPNSLGKNRIGIVVTVAAVKSAVKRNFWKRQVKALFSKMNLKNTDALIVFSSRVNSLTKTEFRKEFKKALE
jgi:ribonuclease P protein component